MALVELLRTRRLLMWHIGILAVLTVFTLYFGQNTTVHVNANETYSSGMQVPFGALTVAAMFFAAIYASSAGTSLNRENPTREISWTKPASRTSIALQFLGIDILAILAVFVLSLGAIALAAARLHFTLYVEDDFGVQLLLSAGVPVMWFAIIQAISCGFGTGARAVGGVIWPVAFFAIGLADVPGPAGAAARALDVINPLAYQTGFSSGSGGTHANALWTIPTDERALCVWGFSLLFGAIAVVVWPRREA